LLLAYETERITEDLFFQAEQHYADVEHKFAQGTASRFDVLQSSVQVSKIMPELVRARNAVDVIKADLKKLLKIKMLDDLTVEDKLAYSLIEVNEGEFLKTAYLNQPQMNLKTLGIDVNKWAIQLAKSTYRPQVNLGANYYNRSNNLGNMFDSNHNNWSAGITVSVPIFDGFSSKGKVDAARARYEESFLDKENTADQIAVDIKKGCLDLGQAKAIIDYTKDNIGEAKEALKISEVSYDNGEGTNLDILDSQVSLSQIKKDYSNAIYDYLMAGAFLDKTMGRLSLGEATK
jgi:outer membrane protein TolC